MKYTITQMLLAAIVAALPLCTKAQVNGTFFDPNNYHNRFATGGMQELPYMYPWHTNTANKTTTTTGSRLIAYAYWHNGNPQDSTIYSYSGMRGSFLNSLYGYQFWQWNYDSSYRYSYDITTNSYCPYPVYGVRNAQTFDDNDNLLTNIQQGWISPTAGFVNAYKSSTTYDAMNIPLLTLSQLWTGAWNNNVEFIYTHTGSRLTAYKYIQWNLSTSSWDSSHAYTYTYNADGNVLAQLDQAWDAGTSTWGNANQYAVTYDASGNPLIQIAQTWDATANMWVNFDKHIFSNFVSNKPQVEICQHWSAATSSWVNLWKDSINYNGFGQNVSEFMQIWNTSTNAWENGDSRHWYYETYVSSVKNITAINGKTTIYPVPAINMLTVAVGWDAPQAFTVSVIDMAGRVCSTWNVPECKQYTNSISVANLAEGNYIVNMVGAKGKVVERLTVVK